jgi:hypothetical protein
MPEQNCSNELKMKISRRHVTFKNYLRSGSIVRQAQTDNHPLARVLPY